MRLALLLTLALAPLVFAGPPGYPSRASDFDVLPGFRNPPPGYGEVPFFWWMGDPLTRERLTWQLDQLKDSSLTSLQVNYAHSDKGGRTHGLTYESDPRLLSEPWWELFNWFLKESGKRGMSTSLSDYTLGWPGQGWYFDEVLKALPDATGTALEGAEHSCAAGAECTWALTGVPVSLMAYPASGAALDVRQHVANNTLRWTPPAGAWRVVAVYARSKFGTLDPMHPRSGSEVIARFFQPFEDHNPGEGGRGLNFFFSDELSFGIRGWLWDARFAAEFQRRKGYDITPELGALFFDLGPSTPKIRMDYSDVMVALEEQNYFKPIYDWHTSRGMLYGCDHGGRGRDVGEFGDYFRTQRWMSAPGCDQPRLGADIIKNKVASSIAHLYERPRVWLEGYHSSGWGTSSADVTQATWRNFASGHNLLTLHGLYYSTHGGWWEWAPPDNHFRMPYWPHLREFLRASERMSFLLSQGHHRADVAILYPVAAVEAGLDSKKSVAASFELGNALYAKGIDFDFMDFESLARAEVKNGELRVAGEAYRVLVLPSMRAVRHSTLQKALQFKRAGGTVLAVGALPEASDRVGFGDADVRAIVNELFTNGASTPAQVETVINTSFPRDFACADQRVKPYMMHRRIGPREVYMVYGVPQNTECSFRSGGKVELWDPWTGTARGLKALNQVSGTTRLRMPLSETEAQLIVFSPGAAAIEAAAPATPHRAALSGDWEFELKPTLDNRFGDFRIPASTTLLGAEAYRFSYSLNGAKSSTATAGFGPQFWRLGPLPETAQINELAKVDPSKPVVINGHSYIWQPVEFSWRWGIENEPGHQGYHGLKEEMPRDLMAFGVPNQKSTDTVYSAAPEGSRYYLWTTAAAPRAVKARVLTGDLKPSVAWINGKPVEGDVTLNAGANPVLLRYDKPGRAYFVLEDSSTPSDWHQTAPMASPWFHRPGLIPFDPQPGAAKLTGVYRFTSPPALRSLKIKALGAVSVTVDGRAAKIGKTGEHEFLAAIARPSLKPATVEITVQHERGYYGGAAITDPIELDCGKGLTSAGDWSQIDGLATYSGGAWYRKRITVPAGAAHVSVDLGRVVSSAELRVNGKTAGVRVAPPYVFDITELAKPGENQIEVLVYNTLANIYQMVPSRYRGETASGLIGPVSLIWHD